MSHEMTIRLTFENPPIPVREMDWQAVIDGREESGPYGRGSTPAEALRALAEAIEEEQS